jgi:hypothetical protein
MTLALHIEKHVEIIHATTPFQGLMISRADDFKYDFSEGRASQNLTSKI